MVEWAANNVFISARQGSARPGFYRAEVTPYIAEILRNIVDPHVREVTLCTGAQVGKSQALLVAMCYLWLFAPGSTMVVQPSDDDVKEFSEKRIKPTLEDSEPLQALIPASKKKHFRAGDYRLSTCSVFLRGAGSPGRLASWAIRYVFLDETDKFPEGFTREGDPVELVRQRMKTFAGREKLIADSTPTTEEGVIWRQFKEGDCREFFVKCEECGAVFPLTFKDVKFENAVEATPAEIAKTARYCCRNCGREYDDAGKNRLVAHGSWKPMQEAKVRGAVSYHLQSIASPWVSIHSLVERFIRAKRMGANQLRVFVNSELAEPWVEADLNLQAVRLKELEWGYPEGGSFPDSSPIEARARVAGVDVQKDYLVLVIREFAPGGASGLVLARRISGFVELDALAEEYHVALTCVDGRYRTEEVTASAVNFPDIVPCWGRPKFTDGTLWRERRQTLTGGHVSGKTSETVVRNVFYDQSAVFEFVSQGMRGERRWGLFKGATLDPVYVKELTAKKKVAGNWQADAEVDDHYADAEKLAMLGAILLGYLVPSMGVEEQPAEEQAYAPKD